MNFPHDGPDPKDPLGMRAYIGEADSVRDRIDASAKNRDFWETAIVVTTSDKAINKGMPVIFKPGSSKWLAQRDQPSGVGTRTVGRLVESADAGCE